MDLSTLSASAQQWLLILAVVAGGYIIGLVLKWIVFSSLRWYGKRHDSLWIKSVKKNLSRPANYFIPLLISLFVLPIANELGTVEESITNTVFLALKILLIITGAWTIIESTDILSDLVRDRYSLQEEDNLDISHKCCHA